LKLEHLDADYSKLQSFSLICTDMMSLSAILLPDYHAAAAFSLRTLPELPSCFCRIVQTDGISI